MIASVGYAKELKICGQQFYPLQELGEGGKWRGTYYDIAVDSCKKAGLECSFYGAPMKRCEEDLKEGTAFAAMGAAKTKEREEFAHYPQMLTELGYTFFVKKGAAKKFKSIADFKDFNVGVHIESATGKDLTAKHEESGKIFKIEGEAKAEIPMKKLAGGRYGDKGAVYCSRPVCTAQAVTEKMDTEAVSFDAKLQGHAIIVSKKSDNADYEKFKKALAQVMKDKKHIKAIQSFDFKVHSESK